MIVRFLATVVFGRGLFEAFDLPERALLIELRAEVTLLRPVSFFCPFLIEVCLLTFPLVPPTTLIIGPPPEGTVDAAVVISTSWEPLRVFWLLSTLIRWKCELPPFLFCDGLFTDSIVSSFDILSLPTVNTS